VFYQSDPTDAKSKWWKDFDGVDKAMDGMICHVTAATASLALRLSHASLFARAAGVCGLFEEKLKTDNPNKKKVHSHTATHHTAPHRTG
jgi:hypothetical protein